MSVIIKIFRLGEVLYIQNYNEIVWSENFDQDTDFNIELTNVNADSEYLIKIQAKQSQKVTLVISSDSKLVQDKEKQKNPERYRIDR